MPYGWEGNRRSGVTLAVRHRLGLSTYGLNGLREMSITLIGITFYLLRRGWT